MARQKGLEPLTYCLEGSCSIQLSYWRISEQVSLYIIALKPDIVNSFLKIFQKIQSFAAQSESHGEEFMIQHSKIFVSELLFGRDVSNQR